MRRKGDEEQPEVEGGDKKHPSSLVTMMASARESTAPGIGHALTAFGTEYPLPHLVITHDGKQLWSLRA